MSDLPTKSEIQQVYESLFRFLDSIPQIISEAEANSDPESLRRSSEKIEFEIQAIKTLSNRLVGLRALAASMLYCVDRLRRLQVIADTISSSESTERIRQSEHGSAELVVILGERLVTWLRNLVETRNPLHDDSDDGPGFDEFLKNLPPDIVEQLNQSPPSPPTKDEVAQCLGLLEEEKAILLVGPNDDSAEHKGERLSSETGSNDKVKQPRNLVTRTKDEIFIGALRNWHKFETSEFNYEPIDVDYFVELMKTTAPEVRGFSRTSLYRRFDDTFGGYSQYEAHCRRGTIVQELKSRSGGYSPHQLRSDLTEQAKAAVEQYRLSDEN